MGDYGAFRKVTATGRFIHSKETYVFTPRSEDGPARMGFRVITPFVLAGGDTILVDRGWVPEALKSPATRIVGQAEGAVEVEGVLRRPAPGGMFTPPPDIANRVFYARNSDSISYFLGLTLRSKLILESESDVAGGPEALPTQENLPDNHLSYALTWYSLAIVMIGVYLRYHFMQGRLRLGS
jgi:surfeit locus 1 family protein